MPSLTQRLSLLDTGPVLELGLTAANKFLRIVEGNVSAENQLKIPAMIDTGAEVTVIGDGVAAALGLIRVGRTFLNTTSSVDVPCFRFDIQLIFPNNVVLQSVIAIEAPLTDQHVRCLIGHDVLQHGLFIYNGSDNSFTLSF